MSKIIKAEKIYLHDLVEPDLKVSDLLEGKFSLFINIKEEESIKKANKNKNEEKPSLKEVLAKAYEEGFKKGYEEGKKKGEKVGYEEGLKLGLENAKDKLAKMEEELKRKFQEQVENHKKEVISFLKKLEESLEDLILNLDKEILTLSLEIAKKLTLKEIEVDKELLLRIIKEALSYIVEGTEILIKVNPQDYSFLQEQLQEGVFAFKGYKIKLVCDPAVSKGGLFIETKVGYIDATLEKRWEKLLAQLNSHAN
ncbi:MAG: FliH/SctL family protein [Caldimicrobium sp.]